MPDIPAPQTSIDRTFELLVAFAELGPGAHRLHDLAEHAGLQSPTAHRILQSGIRAGMVAKTGHGRYMLCRQKDVVDAYAAGELAMSDGYHSFPLSGRARRTLSALQAASGQTVMLQIPVLVETPARHCIVYLPAVPDHFMADARRQRVSDRVFHSPPPDDISGRAATERQDPILRAIAVAGAAVGPSPASGWDVAAAAVPGRTSVAVAIAARHEWMTRHRDIVVARVRAAADELRQHLTAAADRRSRA